MDAGIAQTAELILQHVEDGGASGLQQLAENSVQSLPSTLSAIIRRLVDWRSARSIPDNVDRDSIETDLSAIADDDPEFKEELSAYVNLSSKFNVSAKRDVNISANTVHNSRIDNANFGFSTGGGNG